MPENRLLCGRLGGQFNIINLDARAGGTADVFKAIDINSGEPVAIKLFNKGQISSEYAEEAMKRELQSLQELNDHPHIAKIVDFGEEEGSGHSFIVIEWLERSLLNVIEENPVEGWDRFYSLYGEPLLDALSFAHKREIVHRDIKPANVMFNSRGELRLVDFGISKFKAYWGGAKTFQDWKSPPYSAPESLSIEYLDTKDVFGFAALAISCLQGRELEPLEEGKLPRLLAGLELDGELEDLLGQCLSPEPSDRPPSVDAFIDSLSRISRVNSLATQEGGLRLHLKLTARATDRLEQSFGTQDRNIISRRLKEDLSEACAIRRKSEDTYSLMGATHELLLKIDEHSHCFFVVVAASRLEDWRLETLRQRSMTLVADYQIASNFTSPSSLEEDTLRVLEELDQWYAGAAERSERDRIRRLEGSWKSLLNLQYELERQTQDAISYRGFDADGSQAVFHVEAGEYEPLIGQARVIPLKSGQKVGVTIFAATSDQIAVTVDEFATESLPKSGSLIIDNQLQLSSLKRQEVALDNVMYNRAARHDLRPLLFHPNKASLPDRVELPIYFQEDLDDAKKEAVCSSVGLRDFLVVQGPPGSGKTKMIAEMVLQYLKLNPDHRVLVTSQTHIALDNALERIRELSSNDVELGAVRIARRGDSRVSQAVSDLTLDSMVEKWLGEVRARSSRFLDSWVGEAGIDRYELELGIAVGTLARSRKAFEEAQAARQKVTDAQALVEEKLDLPAGELSEAQLLHYKSRKKQLASEVSEAEADVVQARRFYRNQQKKLLETHKENEDLLGGSAAELTEWEELLVGGSDATRKASGVLELLSDWHQRFGNAQAFYPAFLSESRIVAATCIGIGPKQFKDIKFDLCILDEASKATPLEALLPISKSKKWVLVGDQAQLPPYVSQAARDEVLLDKFDLRPEDLRRTLLDELIENLPASANLMLDTQYRMCRPIGDLISSVFYEGKLATGRGEGVDFGKLCFPKNVTWYCTSRLERRFEKAEGQSVLNRCEVAQADAVLRRLNLVADSMGERFSVCLLSFYSAQVAAFQRMLDNLSSSLVALDVEVHTVDSYQGREADVSIVSMTRSNKRGIFGFVDDANRMNVALSRGREALIVLGDSEFFSRKLTDTPVREVINYIESNPATCAVVPLEDE